MSLACGGAVEVEERGEAAELVVAAGAGRGSCCSSAWLLAFYWAGPCLDAGNCPIGLGQPEFTLTRIEILAEISN